MQSLFWGLNFEAERFPSRANPLGGQKHINASTDPSSMTISLAFGSASAVGPPHPRWAGRLPDR
jgi:hypothetical protein